MEFSPEDYAFLVKVGQIVPADAVTTPTPATKKEEA